MTKKDLHILIDKYFAAETSIKEERLLKEILPMFPDDALASETLATMGMSNIAPAALTQECRSRRGHKIKPAMLSSAAAIAFIILAAGAAWQISRNDIHADGIKCIAYIQGEKISDMEQVADLAFLQLQEIGMVSESTQNEVRRQLLEISKASLETD